MKRVVIESPFAADTPEQRAKHRAYLEDCMLDSLARGESPIASHLIWPGMLDDRRPDERALGIAAGLAWHEVCDIVVVYEDRGISPGMKAAIAHALKTGVQIERRRIRQPIDRPLSGAVQTA